MSKECSRGLENEDGRYESSSLNWRKNASRNFISRYRLLLMSLFCVSVVVFFTFVLSYSLFFHKNARIRNEKNDIDVTESNLILENGYNDIYFFEDEDEGFEDAYECVVNCVPEQFGVSSEEEEDYKETAEYKSEEFPERRVAAIHGKRLFKVFVTILAPLLVLAKTRARKEAESKCDEVLPGSIISENSPTDCALQTQNAEFLYEEYEIRYSRTEVENLGCTEIADYLAHLIWESGGLKNRHWEFSYDKYRLFPYKRKTVKWRLRFGDMEIREVGSIHSHVEVYCGIQEDLRHTLRVYKCYDCKTMDKDELREAIKWAKEPPPKKPLRKISKDQRDYCDEFCMAFDYNFDWDAIYCGEAFGKKQTF